MAKNKAAKPALVDDFTVYIRARLETILAQWRLRCEADPDMNSKKSFSREEFNDQMPLLMDIFLRRLQNDHPELDALSVASEHGLHRWQAGYALIELTREIEHLFSIMLSEFEVFFEKNSDRADSKSMAAVYQQLFKLYGEANKGSTLYYHQLMVNDAGERARNLEYALDQLQQLSAQRGEHLRQSSHDLRASFSILMIGSQMLELPGSETDRGALMEMLNRNLSSIREMLLQLTDYAKIEAGQDTLEIKKFDVAALVRETLKSAEPLAASRNLELQGDGPEVLEVESDRVKVQRILINLLHNALKHTVTGGIYVTWAQETPVRWTLTIQDTGPGFPANSSAALLAEQLKPAVHTSAIHQRDFFQEPPAAKTEGEENIKESEGLGLFIVKKLCELMKASMDIESSPNNGTLVRVRFMSKQEQNRVI